MTDPALRLLIFHPHLLVGLMEDYYVPQTGYMLKFRSDIILNFFANGNFIHFGIENVSFRILLGAAE